jgi:hypothetical protein
MKCRKRQRREEAPRVPVAKPGVRRSNGGVPPSPKSGRKQLRGMEQSGAWRAEVSARIAELEDRLAAVPESAKARDRAIRKSVGDELDRAYTAASTNGVPPSFPAWWTGSTLTRAWEAVHNAELALLQLESPEAVLTTVPRLLAWIQRTMDAGSGREAHEKALKAEIEKEGRWAKPDRVRVRAALADVIGANGRRYAAVRTFRNNLILATLLLIALLLTIAIWHANNPDFLTLCAKEAVNSNKDVVLRECVSGKHSSPVAGEIWLVLLMGALGGTLGIAFRLSASDEAARYDPKTWQRFLKPVTGAATALAAVLFLQSHFLIQPSESTNTRTFYLGYALLFGFSQQLLTRFVDKRAESLVTPDK